MRRSRRRSARRPVSPCWARPAGWATFSSSSKTVADVALVGYPSAGKSSLIASISAAKPKIADYPFTTLHPNLGVVESGESRFTVADVPGLIEGASEGKGLGLEFLRHVERCTALLHVLDCATLEPGRDPLSDLDVILAELAAYPVPEGQTPLLERPQLVALNKVDVPEGRELAEFVRPELEERGYRVFDISAVSREGLRSLTFALAELVEADRSARAAESTTRERIVLRPRAVNEVEVTVTVEGGSDGPLYRIRGAKPERWVHQTDFRNDEAVGYLADRLAKLGVEDQSSSRREPSRVRRSSIGGEDGGGLLTGSPTSHERGRAHPDGAASWWCFDPRIDWHMGPRLTSARGVAFPGESSYFRPLMGRQGLKARAELEQRGRWRPACGGKTTTSVQDSQE